MQLEFENADHPKNGRELGIAGRRQGLLQALPTKTYLVRKPWHALGASDLTQCCREESGIAFFECCIKAA